MGVNTQDLAKQKYKAEKRSYFWRGVGIAIFSGMLYGLYTAFITRGMAVGIWGEWYGDEVFAASYVGIYVLGCIGCAVNDTMGAITMMIMAAIRGCLGDVFRCFKTRPGLLMVGVAMIGGPIANTAYVIGLTMAGPICAAITSPPKASRRAGMISSRSSAGRMVRMRQPLVPAVLARVKRNTFVQPPSSSAPVMTAPLGSSLRYTIRLSSSPAYTGFTYSR